MGLVCRRRAHIDLKARRLQQQFTGRLHFEPIGALFQIPQTVQRFRRIAGNTREISLNLSNSPNIFQLGLFDLFERGVIF